MGYETRLFDNTRVHTVDIVMDDWDELIANATNEEYLSVLNRTGGKFSFAHCTMTELTL